MKTVARSSSRRLPPRHRSPHIRRAVPVRLLHRVHDGRPGAFRAIVGVGLYPAGGVPGHAACPAPAAARTGNGLLGTVRCLTFASLLLAAPLAHADCTDRAAARFRLDADLLRAIAEQESGNRLDAVGPLLAGGNRAIGKMGINTIHLPELGVYGVTRADLFTDCGSVFVGAWILARYVHQLRSGWDAVGVYNTGPASRDLAARARYIAAVRHRYERIRSERLQREYGPRARETQLGARPLKAWIPE